jgi:hypothetical protein
MFILMGVAFYYFNETMMEAQQEAIEATEERGAREGLSPPRAQASTPESLTPPQKVLPPRESMTIIPAVHKGTMKEMWSGLKTLDSILVPTYGLEKMHAEMQKRGSGNIHEMKDLMKNTGYLYVQQRVKGKVLSFWAVYTDSQLVDETTIFQMQEPETILKDALYMKHANGIYFNPKSRACNTTKYAYGINKFGIPEVIGYLQADEEVPVGPYHDLANRAAEMKAWYLVQYYWAMSRREGRPGDDWKRAELAKLKSWWRLNFPGARERAQGELDWFIGKYGSTPEAEALKQSFLADGTE